MHTAAPHRSTGFASISHRLSRDIAEHARLFSGWQWHYDQVTPGRFEGSVTELHLDGMQLVRDRANQAIVKNGAAWSNAVTFSLPLKAREYRVHCQGHVFNGRCLLTAHGDHLPEVCAPADLDVLCVAVDQSLLQEILEHQQRNLSLPSTAGCYRLADGDDPDELIPLIRSLMDEHASQGHALLAHAAIRTGIRDTVLMHLLDLVDSEEITSLAPHARKRVVDRACDYALLHRDAPPSIVDLCNQVGASRRKLQYCFQETLGINPVAYLRSLRLNAAHRDLLQAGGTRNIQDIAAHWGFWHLSRFAADYRRLFGESPSDTLRRGQRDFADFG